MKETEKFEITLQSTFGKTFCEICLAQYFLELGKDLLVRTTYPNLDEDIGVQLESINKVLKYAMSHLVNAGEDFEARIEEVKGELGEQ